MIDLINIFIDDYNIPILSAFLLGILTSISPCPLATNITAIAFISKDIKTARYTLLSGLFYTIGRGVSYTILATLIYFGLSSFHIARIFQGWGDKVLGPFLICIGLVMLGVIKINFSKGGEKVERIKDRLVQWGYGGSFLLGIFFALAFCPYSGVLFFGVLIPLVLNTPESILLPPIYALGTGMPVIFFSFILAFSIQKLGRIFQFMQSVEKMMRYIVAIIFIVAGSYYIYHLILYVISL